jgi:hypothetical protein
MEFYRLVRDTPGPAVWGFLRRAYAMKTVADYGTDPRLVVTEARARTAIVTAGVFIDAIADVIAAPE